jgi:hypothetical protein
MDDLSATLETLSVRLVACRHRLSRRTLMDRLAKAEETVASGAQHVLQQRAALARLGRDGQDAADASRLLALFEQVQAVHVADRDRLLREIES